MCGFIHMNAGAQRSQMTHLIRMLGIEPGSFVPTINQQVISLAPREL